jgi:hypothetical protein
MERTFLMCRLSSLSAFVALALSAGCASIEPPAGYVPLKDPGRWDFRAMSAEGTTLALSVRDNEAGKHGDLTYWSTAFKHEKVKLGNYRLIAEGDIKTDAGREGKLIELRTQTGSAEYVWLVALFVNPSKIYVVEAGGPTKQVDADRDKLLGAIKTLRE